MIRLINKDIDKKNLKGTFALAHEHLNFDLTHIRKDKISKMKEKKLICKELEPALKQGLSLIVDLSNQSMRSNKKTLENIAKTSNLNIVTATGYYLNEYEKENKKSIEEIEKEFIRDINVGFPNSKLKAGIIGEIATSSKKIYNFEKRVFRAAVNVQNKINAAIYTHCNLGKNIRKQIDMLINFGAKTSKTIIGHLDFATNEEIIYALNKGFSVGIDTIGKQKYLSDNERIKKILYIIKKGYEDKLVLSLDISNQSYLLSKNGHGYGYLQNGFYQKIRKEISLNQWKKITFYNIINLLDF